MMEVPRTAIAGLVVAGVAQAQPSNGRLEFEFDRVVVTPSNPEVTLTVLAGWDDVLPKEHAFNGANYDLVSSSGKFSSATLLLQFIGNTPGTVSGGRINGAAIGQLFLGPGCGFPGCPPVPTPLAEYT